MSIFTAADAPEGGNPPPAAFTETCSPPLPHERRTSRLPLLPSGPCGVRRAKGVSGALQLHLSHRRPRGTGVHDSSRLPPLDSGTAPRASAPAYRRFRVPGDAEPPGLVRRHLIVSIKTYKDLVFKNFIREKLIYLQGLESDTIWGCLLHSVRNALGNDGTDDKGNYWY